MHRAFFSSLPRFTCRLHAISYSVANVFQFHDAPFGSMVGQGSLAGRIGDAAEVHFRQRKCFNHVLRSVYPEDLLAGSEKHCEAVPAITDDWYTAGCSFEEPARGTVAVLRHDTTGDVEGRTGRAKECRVEMRGEVRHKCDVR